MWARSSDRVSRQRAPRRRDGRAVSYASSSGLAPLAWGWGLLEGLAGPANHAGRRGNRSRAARMADDTPAPVATGRPAESVLLRRCPGPAKSARGWELA